MLFGQSRHVFLCLFEGLPPSILLEPGFLRRCGARAAGLELRWAHLLLALRLIRLARRLCWTETPPLSDAGQSREAAAGGYRGCSAFAGAGEKKGPSVNTKTAGVVDLVGSKACAPAKVEASGPRATLGRLRRRVEPPRPAVV